MSPSSIITVIAALVMFLACFTSGVVCGTFFFIGFFLFMASLMGAFDFLNNKSRNKAADESARYDRGEMSPSEAQAFERKQLAAIKRAY